MDTSKCGHWNRITTDTDYFLKTKHIYFINYYIYCTILLGMPLNKVMETIEAGMGGTLGHIALIFGLGAILGKLRQMVEAPTVLRIH